MNKKILVLTGLLLTFLVSATSAFAHVSVTPGEVGVGKRLNFVVGVPTEEDDPTVNVRLVLPEGLQSVRPLVKPGWNIQLVKQGEGEDAKVTEIIWSGGAIPAEQKDEFFFSAQAPTEEKTIVWKAYQTYGDGDVVAWENDPKVVAEYTKNNPPKEGEDDHNAPRPWSETKVINDLKASPQANATTGETKVSGDQDNNMPMILSVIAVLLAAGSFSLQFNKRNSKKV
jgi:uncharacterized protein YcnI